MVISEAVTALTSPPPVRRLAGGKQSDAYVPLLHFLEGRGHPGKVAVHVEPV